MTAAARLARLTRQRARVASSTTAPSGAPCPAPRPKGFAALNQLAAVPQLRSTRQARAHSDSLGQTRDAASAEPAPHVGQLEQIERSLEHDVDGGLRYLRTLPPAITAYGGARFGPASPHFATAREVGRLLAQLGVPVRTGAGPGIMGAVPEGYKEAIANDGSLRAEPTQGFNIALPFEQAVDPAIDVCREMQLFALRKIVLHQNARGHIVFPGGFGTLDELFEIWSLATRGRLVEPIVLINREFWSPILAAIERVAVHDRPLIAAPTLGKLTLVDSPDQAVECFRPARVTETPAVKQPDRIAVEMSEAIAVLKELPPAVTVIGGRNLQDDDPTCRALARAASRLTAAGIQLRLGGDGAVARAVVRGVRAANSAAAPQAFLLAEQGVALPKLASKLVVTERMVHKELLGLASRALIALPGGLGTLNELFSVICQIQTGKMPRLPIVLVGRDFWQPIVEALRAQMLDTAHPAISAKDLELVTITDDPAQITRLAGAPSAIPSNAQRSTSATTPIQRRELQAHLEDLGVTVPQADPVRAIADAELAVGQKLEPRVARREMVEAVRRAKQALQLVPAPQTALFGFTRLVDMRFTLDGELLSQLSRLAATDAAEADALRQAINDGPPNHAAAWPAPKSRLELMASLVRHLVLGEGASLQLRLTRELDNWLHTALSELTVPRSEALGGAGGFCANLASALPNVRSHFYSADPIPTRVARNFAPSVRILDEQARDHALAESASTSAPPRINAVAEYGRGVSFDVLGQRELPINGIRRRLKSGERGRVILGAASSEAPGFTMSDAALERVARDHDLIFLAGMHHLTAADSESCRSRSRELARQLALIKRAHPAVLVHHQYVVAKDPAHESLMLTAMRGAVDSFSLNSVELPALLGRLAETAAGNGSPGDLPRQQAEAIDNMLDGALTLRDALGLTRVHVHGSKGDLLVLPGAAKVDRQVLALLRARQLATNKAASERGTILGRQDIWSPAPVVSGAGLAAVHEFADTLQKKFGLSQEERQQVVERWWYRDEASDTTYLFVPSRGIHSRRGGTVSLGDTIDAGALIFALEPRRAPQFTEICVGRR